MLERQLIVAAGGGIAQRRAVVGPRFARLARPGSHSAKAWAKESGVPVARSVRCTVGPLGSYFGRGFAASL